MSRPTSGPASDTAPNRGRPRRDPTPIASESSPRRADAARDVGADIDFPAFPTRADSDLAPPRRLKRPPSMRALPSPDPFYPADEEAPWLDEGTEWEVAPAKAKPRPSASSGKSKSRAAKNRASKSRSSARRLPPAGLMFEVGGVLCLAMGVLLVWNAVRAQAEGWLPRALVFALRWTFGVGSFLVPLLLIALGGILMVRRQHTNLRAFGRGVTIALPVLLTGVHLNVASGSEFQSASLLSHGGVIGAAFAWILRRAVGDAGAVIALLAFSVVALLFLTEISLAELGGRVGEWIGSKVGNARSKAKSAGDEWRADLDGDDFDQTPDEQELHPVSRPKTRHVLRSSSPQIVPSIVTRALPQIVGENQKPSKRPSPFLPLEEIVPPVVEPNAEADELASDEGPRIEILNVPPPVSVVEESQENDSKSPQNDLKVPQGAVSPSLSDEEMTPNEALEAQALATAGQGQAPRAPRPQRIRRRFGDGPLMPEYFDDAVRSLDAPIVPDTAGVEDDIAHDVQAVQDTLLAFKIDARVTDVKRGPVITRYEVQPAPGVRVAAIANLDRDMARSLSAIAVRIEAPVPGKNVVGIEVPNRRVHLVRLRDVLELPEFLSAPSKLSFVLGKDIAGQPKWADLTKMPHMLVAGATNSGKSVCLNTIISSIITRATPEEVKFSLIDPKRVELTLYRDIPHLYHPVVVEPKEAVKVLRGMIVEMDRRYKKFAARGVRNIVSFNAKLEEDEAPLPYIVIVIDELADLMMTAAAEFEKLICRLAQLARATGIHLIVATQRPSVNVITGVIKANIPARVAFAVASQVDSRTILDAVGAERLIGSGDMLFDANNGGKAVRIQGAYLSEEEVNRIVEVVKNHYWDQPREYGLDLSAMEEEDASEEKPARSDDRRDDLYDEIKVFIARHQEMSASMIQRKFEIGYPRAARIVDQFERDGILGPADGPKPRKVIGAGRD